jgi:hypothetical protein
MIDEIIIPPDVMKRGRLTLRLHSPQRDGAGIEYVVAELTGDTLAASTRVYAWGIDSLAALFEEMAIDWKGWTGAKEWESVEGEFSLSCINDGRGHITIHVKLLASPYPDSWSVRCSVVVEAGQMDAVASQMKRFVG